MQVTDCDTDQLGNQYVQTLEFHYYHALQHNWEVVKHLIKKSIMEAGRKDSNKSSISGKCEATRAKVVEMTVFAARATMSERYERTPMRSHGGLGRALKM